MVTPKKIIIKDLELADKEIARLRKENEELREHKENLIRADKKKTEYIDKLEKENKELKAKNRALELRLEKALVYNI